MFGDYPWLQSKTRGLLSLSLGDMARDMRVSRSRLREQLEWLAEWNYVTELTFQGRSASLRLSTPPNLDYEYQMEREAALVAIQQREALRAYLVEIEQESPEDE